MLSRIHTARDMQQNGSQLKENGERDRRAQHQAGCVKLNIGCVALSVHPVKYAMNDKSEESEMNKGQRREWCRGCLPEQRSTLNRRDRWPARVLVVRAMWQTTLLRPKGEGKGRMVGTMASRCSSEHR